MAARRHIVNADGKKPVSQARERQERQRSNHAAPGRAQQSLPPVGGAQDARLVVRVRRVWFPGEKPEKFTLLEMPDYGHMDVFIGKNSARDVYPKILEALENMRVARVNQRSASWLGRRRMVPF